MNLDKWIPENLGNNIESEVGCKPFRAKKIFQPKCDSVAVLSTESGYGSKNSQFGN